MLKKISVCFLAACTCVSTLVYSSVSMHAKSNDIAVNYTEDSLEIGNEYLMRTYDIRDNKIHMGSIENKRINKTLTPQNNSELFTIHGNDKKDDLDSNVIDRSNWTGYVSNSNGEKTTSDISAIIDGDENSIIDCWGASYKDGFPISLTIDLGENQEFQSFSYLKRPGYPDETLGINGTIGKYKFQISNDGNSWQDVQEDEFTKEEYNLHQIGNLYNVGDLVYRNFVKSQNARYIRIVMLSGALSDDVSLTGAELNLYKGIYQDQTSEEDTNVIKSSDLIVEDITNENTKTGKKVTVSFEPYEYKETLWDIDYVTTMDNDDFYMRSYLDINVAEPEKAIIDYIDIDSIVLGEDAIDVWHHPAKEDIFTERLGAYELSLGQPVYATGMFFGSEFPATDTDVKDNVMQIRYFSGKSFEQLEQEGKLNDGTFTTWSNVVGAARGTDRDVVQTDLFEYIDEIATKTDFRKQYNSWYDNMMAIDDNSIEKSFYEVEEAFSKQGIEPLDAYVVDDGWNNYRAPEYSNPSVSDSGNEDNRTGFWEFNSKFPNELYPSSSIADKLNSTFGLWLGPQGGYAYFGGFANYLESQGTGFAQDSEYWNGKTVCVGSNKYLNNLTKLFVDYQSRFDISYWKLDGFSVNPCKNKNHDHMTGGYNNMYYTSELWENNIAMFSKMRQERESKEKDLYINATSYVNPSPWLLQWVNAVYTQDAWDLWFDDTQGGSQVERAMTYRDNVYFNFIKVNEFQFPLKNIYNHDPIYGVSSGLEFTDDEFRKYMIENATRGTGFWELYFSPSMFNDAKWKITTDVLDWAEDNFHILQNAKLFGETPTKGNVYGYSAWDGSEGIVSFRNPTNVEKTYSLKLDELVGVTDKVKNVSRVGIYPYANKADGEVFSYGDTINVTLKPFETIVYSFGNKDKTAPKLTSAKIKNSNTIKVVFDERVSDEAEFIVNGQEVTATLMDDYRTFEVSCENLKESATLEISKVKDIYGNSSKDINQIIKTANAIAKVENKDDLGDDVIEYNTKIENKVMMDLNEKSYSLANKGIEGIGDFGISMAIATTVNDATLLKQGDDFSVSIDKNGYVNFTVKGETISSKETVTTVTEKAHGTFNSENYVETKTQDDILGKVNDGKLHSINASREPNGQLKLYVDGRLCSSFYNKKSLNLELDGDSILLGSNEYNGYIGAVEVANSAKYYSDAIDYANSFMINIDDVQVLRDNWNAEACSEANMYSDGVAADTIDGNESTYWHSNYTGDDHCEGKHHLTIDFGKTISFDNLTYLARPGGGNGTWTNVIVIGIDENGNETILIDNQEISLTDNAYKFAFDTTQSFRKVRFEITGVGGFASAAEIYATLNYDKPATDNALWLQNDAEKLYSEIDSKNYTEDSYKVFEEAIIQIRNINPFIVTKNQVSDLKDNMDHVYSNLVPKARGDKVALKIAVDLANAITDKDLEKVIPVVADEFIAARDEANAVYNSVSASQVEVNNAFDRLASAMQKLEFYVGDKTALKAFIDKVSSLDSSKYTTDTWAAFETELNEAIAVYEDLNAMQEEVNNAYSELVTAFLNLRLIPDKSLLEELINQAEGLDSANYTKATFDGLTKALNEAKVVYENPNVTQKEVDNAKAILEKAIAGLQTNPIKPSNVDNTVKTPVNNGDTTSVKTGDDALVGTLAGLSLLSIVGAKVLRKKED